MDPVQVIPALLGVWLLFSLLGLVSVLLPLLAPPEDVLALSPQCIWQAEDGTSCPTCGMTRGFVAMAGMDLSAATGFNPASPWLFGLFLINGLAAISFAIRWVRRLPAVSKLSMTRGI